MKVRTIDDYKPEELNMLPKSAWPIGISPKWLKRIEQDPGLLRIKYADRKRVGKTAKARKKLG